MKIEILNDFPIDGNKDFTVKDYINWFINNKGYFYTIRKYKNRRITIYYNNENFLVIWKTLVKPKVIYNGVKVFSPEIMHSIFNFMIDLFSTNPPHKDVINYPDDFKDFII